MTSITPRRAIPAQIKKLARSVAPPVLWQGLTRIRGQRYGFSGDYSNFSKALSLCGKSQNYDSNSIREYTVRQATQEKQRSEERTAGSRALQLLAAFSSVIAARKGAKLRVLDFGGGLGNHYFQVRRFLPIEIEWVVGELEGLVSIGKADFQNDELRFELVSENLWSGDYDLILASSVLQYVDNPVDTFSLLSSLPAPYLLINRFPLWSGPKDRVTIQKVPPQFFDEELPAWFFSEDRWRSRFNDHARDIFMEWEVPQDTNMLDGQALMQRGFLLKSQ